MPYRWNDDGTYVWYDDADFLWGDAASSSPSSSPSASPSTSPSASPSTSPSASPSASTSPGNQYAEITGTATEIIFETDIITGNKTIIITLFGNTWVPESY